LLLRGFGGFLWDQFFKYPPVLAENIVDVPNAWIAIILKSVVKSASAIIIAEFFVGPPFNRPTAGHAGFVCRDSLHLIRLNLKINEDANACSVFSSDYYGFLVRWGRVVSLSES
jgi:hypothetical protein